MGVWIETHLNSSLDVIHLVTPCVGVWIETKMINGKFLLALSHPAWVCGLKPALPCLYTPVYIVTPCVGVWIETIFEPQITTSH